MASRVQTVKEVIVPPKTEVALSCRLTSHNYTQKGLIESSGKQVALANRPGKKGSEIVRCISSQLVLQLVRLPVSTRLTGPM